MSNQVFCAIETELIAKLSTVKDTRYKFFRNEKTTTISMNAELPESIASEKAVLRSIVTGQAVAHTPLLMSLLRSQQIAHSVELEIQRLNAQNEAYGLLNCRKQEIRLFGSLEAICTLEKNPWREQNVCANLRWRLSIFITGWPVPRAQAHFNVFCPVGVAGYQESGNDCRGRLCRCQEIMANVHKLQRLSSAGGKGDASDDWGTTSPDQNLCPVCFCPPEEDASGAPIQLSCSHSYCKDCSHDWITGTRTCQFSLKCLADGSSSSPPLEALERCLTRDEFLRSMREAVDDHVNKNFLQKQVIESIRFHVTK